MNERKPNRVFSFITRSFDVLMRIMAGAIILIIVLVVAPLFPQIATMSRSGPSVPIPTVDPATLALGRHEYKTQDCSDCHVLHDAGPAYDNRAAPQGQLGA